MLSKKPVLMLMLVFALFFSAAMAADFLFQPSVDSATGMPVPAEPATPLGKVIYWVAQVIGGTAATYIITKWLKGVSWLKDKIDGHTTLAVAMAISWLTMFGLSTASLKLFHYDPGMQLGTLASFGSLFAAMLIKEYRKLHPVSTSTG